MLERFGVARENGKDSSPVDILMTLNGFLLFRTDDEARFLSRPHIIFLPLVVNIAPEMTFFRQNGKLIYDEKWLRRSRASESPWKHISYRSFRDIWEKTRHFNLIEFFVVYDFFMVISSKLGDFTKMSKLAVSSQTFDGQELEKWFWYHSTA